MKVLNYGDQAVSVALEEVESRDWTEKVRDMAKYSIMCAPSR
jgi:phenylpyruvate tautomerase PptA (4-oxalocrotonate tautomerase family)